MVASGSSPFAFFLLWLSRAWEIYLLPALIQELDCIRKQPVCVSESSNGVDNPIGFRLTITLTDLIGICRKVAAFARFEDPHEDRSVEVKMCWCDFFEGVFTDSVDPK